MVGSREKAEATIHGGRLYQNGRGRFLVLCQKVLWLAFETHVHYRNPPVMCRLFKRMAVVQDTTTPFSPSVYKHVLLYPLKFPIRYTKSWYIFCRFLVTNS